MIIDRLDNAYRYSQVHPGFADAFEFLKKIDVKTLQPGKYPIDGDRVYAIVQTAAGRGPEEARLEVHRNYIDIQLTLKGHEVYGWRPLEACSKVSEPFCESDDIGFFDDRPESWLPAPADYFVIFFPDDAHAPLSGREQIEKVIIKVAV